MEHVKSTRDPAGMGSLLEPEESDLESDLLTDSQAHLKIPDTKGFGLRHL